MSVLDRSAPARRPTTGYYLALAAALVGFVGLAIAVEGARQAAAAGGDGLAALNGAGVPALVLAWGIAFHARLGFSEKISPLGRARGDRCAC